MINFFKKYSTQLTILLIGILVLFSSLNVKWGGDRWHSLLRDDAKGYYAYLPAVFIYQDLSFSFYDTVENRHYRYPSLSYDYRYTYEGRRMNKYYSGTSLFQMPFFLMAHVLSKPLGYASDGYSKIYWISIGYAAIFYLLLGLWFLSKVLVLYEIPKPIINLVLFIITMGTHLFYYTSFEPGMSHVYSFALISYFVLLSKKYFKEPNKWTILQIAAIIGLITLIRPVNALVVFLLPFLAGDMKTFTQSFQNLIKKQLLFFIIGLIIMIMIAGIQLVLYKIQSGYFFIYSYGSQGFNFMDPHMIDILFSYRKGLFLYTPITFISLFAAITFYKKDKYLIYTFAAFFLILTYIFASWSVWWYGGSYSSRVYVEFLPVFAILLALLLMAIETKKWRNRIIVVLFFLVLFNQKQTYLYRIGYIHYQDMTKEKYWESLVHPFNWWYYDIRNKVLTK